jgi:hypothetical protein
MIVIGVGMVCLSLPYPTPLAILDSYWFTEGANDREELREVFKSIFRGEEPASDRTFYLHFFKLNKEM